MEKTAIVEAAEALDKAGIINTHDLSDAIEIIRRVLSERVPEKTREAAIAQAYDRSTVEIKLGADHGELLSAETVGGAITNAAKLLKLAAKDCGYKAEVLVRGIEYKDGEMLARLLVCRLAKGLKKRERSELVRRMAEEAAQEGL